MEKSTKQIGDSPTPVVVDRISELPDSILLHIFSLLPFKSTVRISVLSKRWRNLCEHFFINTDTLDFGEDFAGAATKEQLVDTVNRYLQLHKRSKIHKLRLLVYGGIEYQVHANKWLEFAVQRSVKDLDFDFGETDDDYDAERLKLPDFLFSCDSPLTHLKLGRFDFSPPLGFTGFGSLVSLYLRWVSITDNALENVLLNCRVLSVLSLWECNGLESIKILGPKEFQLKRLLVGNCYDAYEIDVLAPNLKSFHFCGDLLRGCSFRNVSALEDVYISSDASEITEPVVDYIDIVSSVCNIKILTVGIGPFSYVTDPRQFNHEVLPVNLPNLQELQIQLGGPLDEDYLFFMYKFFKFTLYPCLEKLFIELDDMIPIFATYNKEGTAKEPFNCWFYNLKAVKITNFQGRKTEMRLVKFVLRKSLSLELLVLVAAQKSDLEKQISHVQDSAATTSLPTSSTITTSLHDKLLILPKASNDARIVLCGDWEAESRSLSPTHTKYERAPDPFPI